MGLTVYRTLQGGWKVWWRRFRIVRWRRTPTMLLSVVLLELISKPRKESQFPNFKTMRTHLKANNWRMTLQFLIIFWMLHCPFRMSVCKLQHCSNYLLNRLRQSVASKQQISYGWRSIKALLFFLPEDSRVTQLLSRGTKLAKTNEHSSKGWHHK